MRVILFGATGMVGQGVLRECLRDSAVVEIVCVGRTPVSVQDPKVKELVTANLFELDRIEDKLSGLDACFFCLGVSSSGMSEQDYRHLTYDLTLSVATVLARINPGMTFVYVSGAGTDSTERGRSMWARVKGATENALLRLPFKATGWHPVQDTQLSGFLPSVRRVLAVASAALSPCHRLDAKHGLGDARRGSVRCQLADPWPSRDRCGCAPRAA
jgi:uncharacterized protein YbjT (DUF2867 family)